MRTPGGHVFITSPDQKLTEIDCYTCKHCNSIKMVPPKSKPEDLGGLCKQCMGLICPKCVDHGHCVPFEKQLERMEAKGRALRSYGLA